MRKHPGWRESLNEDHSIDSSEDTDVDSDEEDMAVEESGYTISEIVDNNSYNMNDCEVNIDMIGAHFLLNLKEKYKVTQVALDFVLDKVVEFIAIASAKIKCNVLDKLKELNHDVEEILSDCFLPIDPFSQMRTEYEQTKFYKEHFGLIVSCMLITVLDYTCKCYFRNPLLFTLAQNYDIKDLALLAN